MSKLGKMILAMCDSTGTGHMMLNTKQVYEIAGECDTFMHSVIQYATELGVWVIQ